MRPFLHGYPADWLSGTPVRYQTRTSRYRHAKPCAASDEESSRQDQLSGRVSCKPEQKFAVRALAVSGIGMGSR